MAIVFTYDDEGPIRKVIATWESDGSGDAAGTSKKIGGFLLKGQTNPGTAAPTASYGIVLTDDEGVNLLAQSHDDLLARSATVTEEVYFNLEMDAGEATSAYPAVNDAITVTVAAAGDTKAGVVTLYYLKPW